MSLSLGMHTHTIWIGKWYKRRHINSITIPEIHPELYASSLLLVILPLNSLALHTYLIWKKNNNNTKNRNDSKQNEPTFATFNIYVHFVRLQMLNKTARYDLMSAFVWNWNFLLNSLLHHPHFNPLSHSLFKYIDMYVCMYIRNLFLRLNFRTGNCVCRYMFHFVRTVVGGFK